MSAARVGVDPAVRVDTTSKPATRSTPVTRVEILDAIDDVFVSGPAGRTELVGVARIHGARGEIVDLLEHLPDRRYTHQRQLWTDLPHIPVGL